MPDVPRTREVSGTKVGQSSRRDNASLIERFRFAESNERPGTGSGAL